MKTRATTLAATGAALALGLALTGCGTGSKSSSAGTNADGKVTLRFTWWGNDTRNKVTNQAIEAFMKANPNIVVKAEPGEWGSYWDKLATQMAANDAPDIIQMDEKYISDYSNRGALLDLEKAGVSVADLAAGTVDMGKTSKGLTGINAGVNSPVIMANPKVVQAAGAAMPDDKTWTWESMEALAKQITDKSPKGTFGSTSMGGSDAMLSLQLRQNGSGIFGPNGLAMDAAGASRFFTMVKKWQDDGASPTSSIAAEDLTKPLDQSLTAQGKVAFSTWWSNQIAALDKASGQDLKIMRPPSTDGTAKGQQKWYKASMLWSASSKTKNPEAVAKFINFLANDEAAAKIMLTERGVPANTKMLAAIKPQLTGSDKKIVDYIESIAAELGDTPTVTPQGGSTFQADLQRYSQEVMFGRQTPEQAGEALVNEAKGKVKAS